MAGNNRIVTNFTLSVDGIPLIGKVKSVNPPNVQPETDTIRPGGMEAPQTVVLGLQSLDMSFVLFDYNPEILKLSGLRQNKEVQAVINGFIAEVDGTQHQVKMIAGGLITGVDRGSYENGSVPEMEFTMEGLNSYKELFNGDVVHDINIRANQIVSGQDDLGSSFRQLLGISTGISL